MNVGVAVIELVEVGVLEAVDVFTGVKVPAKVLVAVADGVEVPVKLAVKVVVAVEDKVGVPVGEKVLV